MYSRDGDPDFKWLHVLTQRHKSGIWYSVRLTSALDRKTIGVGKDKIRALNAARAIDERIDSWVHNRQAVDLDVLKDIAKEYTRLDTPRDGGLRVIRKDDVSELWRKYVAFHTETGAWEQTYILTHVKTVTSLVTRCPYQRLEQKSEIFRWFVDSPKRSPKTSKSRLTLLVAAIDWASRQGMIPRSWGGEYRDLLDSLKVRTKKGSVDEDDIQIFSLDEIHKILDALKNDTYSRFSGRHKQYYPYAHFCWLTGCRPSEAIALKWHNVDLAKGKIIFAEGEVNASGQIIKKRGTKTERKRVIPMNTEIKQLLTELLTYRCGEYVFVGHDGKPISQHAFNRVWETLLKKLDIPYRVPYHLRHTMISYHANNDFPLHKLAELVGNSEKVIREHYFRVDVDRIHLPDVVNPN